MNNLSKKIVDALNLIIFLIGIIFIIISFLFFKDLRDVLVNIGASFISTAFIAWITRHYIFELDKKKEIIENWGLKNIYDSKTIMNQDSNLLLDKCKKNLDIMAIGMSGYLAAKENELKTLVRNGCTIRLLVCNPNSDAIIIRANDEPSTPVDKLKSDILELRKWVKDMNTQYSNNDLSIKYHNTYPAFAYLRIDKNIFWGPNLYLMPSQQSMAFSFDSSGKGFDYFSNYFDKLWDKSNFANNME
jgi:hypothetical protein